MRALRTIAALTFAAGIAGCGQTSAVPGISAAAATHRVAAPAAPGLPTTNATVKLLIPNPKASPAAASSWGYLSPGTQSIRIAIASNYLANVTSTSPGCKKTAAGVACVLTNVPVYAHAKQSALVATFDQTLGGGGRLRGHMLSFGQTNVVVRRSGAPVAIVLNPILGSIQASLAATTVPAGPVTTVPVALTVLDPAGYVIPSGKLYSESSLNYATKTKIYVDLSQPGVEDGYGFNIVAAGKQYKTSATLSDPRQSLAVRYQGRGGHDAVIEIGGVKHPVKLTLSALPGVGKSLAIGAVGPASSMTLSSKSLWFTEPLKGAIASIGIYGQKLHEIPLAAGKTPLAIAAVFDEFPGRNDNPVDIAESGNVIGFVKTSGRITEYTVPTPNAGLYGISPGSQNVWFTERTAGKIGLLNLGGYFSEYNAPIGSTPATIRDGMFTDPGLNGIGYVHSDGGVGEYRLPHPHSKPADITNLPISPTAFWFTEASAARVGSVSPYDGRIHEYPTHAPLKNIAAGADLWVYATDTNGDIEMIAPSGEVTLMTQPVPGFSLIAIVAGRDHDLWVLASNATTSVIKEILY